MKWFGSGPHNLAVSSVGTSAFLASSINVSIQLSFGLEFDDVFVQFRDFVKFGMFFITVSACAITM